MVSSHIYVNALVTRIQIDVGLVHMKQDGNNCNVQPKTLLDYDSKSRWNLHERENNCLTFDF